MGGVPPPNCQQQQQVATSKTELDEFFDSFYDKVLDEQRSRFKGVVDALTAHAEESVNVYLKVLSIVHCVVSLAVPYRDNRCCGGGVVVVVTLIPCVAQHSPFALLVWCSSFLCHLNFSARTPPRTTLTG